MWRWSRLRAAARPPQAHCPPLPAVDTPSAKTDGGSKLTERQKDVLREIVRDASVTSEHLAEALGMGRRSVEREIAVLRNAGYIAKSGRDNRSPWLVLREIEVNDTRLRGSGGGGLRLRFPLPSEWLIRKNR